MIAFFTDTKSSSRRDEPLELRGLQNSSMEVGMLCRGRAVQRRAC